MQLKTKPQQLLFNSYFQKTAFTYFESHELSFSHLAPKRYDIQLCHINGKTERDLNFFSFGNKFCRSANLPCFSSEQKFYHLSSAAPISCKNC